ncbi:MAG: 23S rRNA (pseudouridine(1915)-N(3))-methyltransferase RlmH [Acidobacteriota bacterium]|nr:23S rRNA (pseudouridine(1915)-N(3))-methyltransferase RlmH [Acidobacteriota bacterium]
MRLKLIWVGRENRRDPESELCRRYRERLRPHGRLEETVIKSVQSGNTEETREKESRKILDALDSRDFVVLCDERGKGQSSPELARFLEQRERDARRPVWIIGGAMGVSAALRQRADFMLSLSKMTLPHALARVVLLEQIYRAFTIKAGHPYHHEG